MGSISPKEKNKVRPVAGKLKTKRMYSDRSRLESNRMLLEMVQFKAKNTVTNVKTSLIMTIAKLSIHVYKKTAVMVVLWSACLPSTLTTRV